jgi:hypothetical protein
MQKMMFQKTIEYRRPNLSAMGAAMIAPSKVPMESKPTMVPERTLLNAGLPFFVLSPKRPRKSDISRKPEI